MTRYLVGGLLVIASALSVLALLYARRQAVDEPSYQVVRQDGDIEIREYRGYAIAEITVSADFGPATQRAFTPLFNYISGANRSRAKIDMTAPVLVEPASEKIEMTAPVLVEPRRTTGADDGQSLTGDEISAWSIAFILPEEYTADNAPLPNDSRVTVRGVDQHRVAVIRFSGRFNERRAEEHRLELANWLARKGLEHAADWRIAGYNPPFTLPAMRRNEVFVTLR